MMLVGELHNIAQGLRSTVNDIKKGIKDTFELGDKVIKAGQAVFSSIQKKIQEGQEKEAKKRERQAKERREQEKRAKEEHKNERRGTQQ